MGNRSAIQYNTKGLGTYQEPTTFPAINHSVLLTLLAKVGIVSSRGLKKYRRYAYVGMFVVAAVITPPDVITQTGLALPLIALYEISILMAGWVETKPVDV